MKTVLILSLALAGTFASAATTTKEVTAADLAVYTAFATYTNQDCTLKTDLDVKEAAKPITYTLHTATKDVSASFDPQSKFVLTVDEETGNEVATGQGLTIEVTNWDTISKLKLNDTECTP